MEPLHNFKNIRTLKRNRLTDKHLFELAQYKLGKMYIAKAKVMDYFENFSI